ncbi:SPOR domain-containing protein [Mucilaginibacter glaciei]|uniref:SPOR domain-containing protein n=1 Tax=Mucilaginibacter glaciei TaxID=2772109 RepID=A0A926S195_9SPHI|nr:SPOR domain-containing protein [Mucilaginibacter glaciei]MBD1392843.1 SPOR domain-containing protein [Mucilaginibacter glaciei]
MKKAIFDQKAKPALFRYCFFCLLLFSSTITFGQTRGNVQVIREPLFDTLLSKRAMLNTGRNSSGLYTSSYGYRVQIYSGSKRTAAFNAQARFNSEFPEMRTYIIYHEPNFKVRAGDFRTRIEAERMKNQLNGTFSAMFIISEKINPPKTVISND